MNNKATGSHIIYRRHDGAEAWVTPWHVPGHFAYVVTVFTANSDAGTLPVGFYTATALTSWLNERGFNLIEAREPLEGE